MATYLMLGRVSQEAVNSISAKRTERALALLRDHGGTMKAGYALLGDRDLALVIDLPDNEAAMKTSVGLSRLLSVTFDTMPAVTVEEFDRLVG
jgi:uncharacterized protein with GYD domain